MIGVYVYLHDLVICYQNQLESPLDIKIHEAVYFLVWKGACQKNNKLCTVAKLDLCFCLRNLRYTESARAAFSNAV